MGSICVFITIASYAYTKTIRNCNSHRCPSSGDCLYFLDHLIEHEALLWFGALPMIWHCGWIQPWKTIINGPINACYQFGDLRAYDVMEFCLFESEPFLLIYHSNSTQPKTWTIYLHPLSIQQLTFAFCCFSSFHSMHQLQCNGAVWSENMKGTPRCHFASPLQPPWAWPLFDWLAGYRSYRLTRGGI